MFDKGKSLKLNFIMNVILTLSSVIFPLVTFPYVSRILMPDGMGKVAFALSVVSYFAMFAQLGIPTYGIRACAQVRDDREALTRTAQEIFVINFVMTLLACVVFLLSLIFVPRLSEERVLFLVVGMTLIFNAIGMEWLYKALEEYTYITVRSVAFKFIALLGMLLLVHEEGDYVIYGALVIFAASASNICNFINLRKYIDMRRVGAYSFRRHFKAIGIFFAMSCATTVYTNLNTAMLGFMRPAADVGLYDAAVKVKGVLVSVVTSLGAVLLPRASYYVEHGMEADFQRITRKAINFVFLLAVPLCIYFTAFAEECILILAGDAYGGAVLPMQLIMPTLVFIGLSNIMGIQILVPLGLEKVVLYSEIAGAVVDLILNVLLIPPFGAVGAAVGAVAAELVVTVWQYRALRGTVTEAYRAVRYAPIVVGTGVALAVSIWLKSLGLAAFLTIFASATVFFGLYLLVLTLAGEPLTREIEVQVWAKVRGYLGRK